MSDSIINAGIIATYILLGIATLVAIVGPVIQLIGNSKGFLPTILGIVGISAVLFVGYVMASNETYEGISPFASQAIGGSIIATMILIVLAVLSAVFIEIAKFFK